MGTKAEIRVYTAIRPINLNTLTPYHLNDVMWRVLSIKSEVCNVKDF